MIDVKINIQDIDLRSMKKYIYFEAISVVYMIVYEYQNGEISASLI